MVHAPAVEPGRASEIAPAVYDAILAAHAAARGCGLQLMPEAAAILARVPLLAEERAAMFAKLRQVGMVPGEGITKEPAS